MEAKRDEPKRAEERLEEALAILLRLGAQAFIDRTQQELGTLPSFTPFQGQRYV